MFTVAEIGRATSGRILPGGSELTVTTVSTDSRSIRPGELFVPLRGERFDGHRFLAQVYDSGVKVVLVEERWLQTNPLPAGITAIAVEDTLHALGTLAAFHRQRFTVPIIGITGSNGKTTTKEMLATILSLTGEGLKTSGNLNNLIGLPQMLFRLTTEHRWAVLEMGMSEPGEIDRLAEIAAPEVGVITNVYPAHLQSMGSVEAVAKAKGELFMRLPAGAAAIYNADAPLVAGLPVAAGVRKIGYGISTGEIRATSIEKQGIAGQSFALSIEQVAIKVKLRAYGTHNVYNALAAASAAHVLGVSGEIIRQGLESFRPYDKRFSLEELGDVILVDDSYNANPASVAAALTTLGDVAPGRRIAVLGDMLELGEGSVAAHRQIGEQCASTVDWLLLLGENAGAIAEGALAAGMDRAQVVVAESHEEILALLLADLRQGDAILIKGSRGMNMDRIASGLRQNLAQPSAHEGGA